jgi:hypothetical protein
VGNSVAGRETTKEKEEEKREKDEKGTWQVRWHVSREQGRHIIARTAAPPASLHI